MPSEMGKGLTRFRNDYLRYGTCWEDAETLIKGLDCRPGNTLISIGSAGDNSLSLLTTDPETVMAVDVNYWQTSLIELKKAAFSILDYESLIEFLGFSHSGNRLKLFESVRTKLSPEQKKFWEQHSEIIQKGVAFQGKFEKYLRFFSSNLLPLIHSRNQINRLLETKSADDQIDFYTKHWNTFRWKLLFKLFFNRLTMGRFGRDPRFFNEVDQNVHREVFLRAENHLSNAICQENHFLEYILTGKFTSALPHYLLKENFNTIKSNIHRLSIRHESLLSVLQEGTRFSGFNLSNIFEYMNRQEFEEIAKWLYKSGMPSSRYVYWNLFIDRSLHTIKPDYWMHQSQLSSELSATDPGFFYSCVQIDQLS